MAEEIKQELGIESRLIPGAAGVFEVVSDGKVIYEKAKTGRFPEKGEILKLLRKKRR